MKRNVALLLAGALAGAAAVTAVSEAAHAAESKITILYDAFGNDSAMKKDWGFAALVEVETNAMELLDAVVFALEGVEENAQEKHRLTPWRRQVIGRSIEFSSIGKNFISWSDAELIRYVEKISPAEKCSFHRESLMEFPKGKSETEFTAYTAYTARGVHCQSQQRLPLRHVFPAPNCGDCLYTRSKRNLQRKLVW